MAAPARSRLREIANNTIDAVSPLTKADRLVIAELVVAVPPLLDEIERLERLLDGTQSLCGDYEIVAAEANARAERAEAALRWIDDYLDRSDEEIGRAHV